MRIPPYLVYLLPGLLLSFPVVSTGQTAQPIEKASAPLENHTSYVVEDGRLQIVVNKKRREVSLPEPALAALAHGDKLYVAVGEAGVLVIDIGNPEKPVVTRRIPISHGSARSLFEQEGAVWMMVSATTAVRLSSGSETAASPPVTPLISPLPITDTPSATPSPEKKVVSEEVSNFARPVKVIDVLPGIAKLDAGKNLGIKNGDRLEVYRRSRKTEADGVSYASRDRVAILEIIAVSDATSLAALHRGDRILRSDEVSRPKSDDKPSKMFPRRLFNLAEASIVLRPLINVNKDSGFGALCDLSATYWGSFFFVGLRIQPLGFGWTRSGGVLSTAVLGEAGYDRREFAIGLGAGFGATTGDMAERIGQSFVVSRSMEADGVNDADEVTWDNRTKVAFALTQVVRLGPKDGLNLLVVNRLMYYVPEKDQSQMPDYWGYVERGFKYAGTTGRMAIPMTHALDLVLEGGGGRMGYGFGAIGVMAWLKGRGDVGSWGLTASAGGAAVWGSYLDDDGDVETVNIAGPLIGLGLTHRFGPSF